MTSHVHCDMQTLFYMKTDFYVAEFWIMSGKIVSVIKSKNFIVHLFCSVSSSAHTLIIILRVITQFFFFRWKYVSISVIEVLCERRSLSVTELTLPSVTMIIIRRLWYTHYYNWIGPTTILFSSDVTHTMSYYAT